MSGYSPMPAPPPPSGPGYGAPQRGPAPSTVVNAVRIMFALAALGAISVIVLFADKDGLRNQIRDKNPGYDTKRIDDALNVALTVGAVIAVILLVLYVLLALQVRKGKQWARVVTWVFSGLGALGALSNLAGTQTATTKALSAVELIAYLALIVLLAMKPSNDYFRRPAYGAY